MAPFADYRGCDGGVFEPVSRERPLILVAGENRDSLSHRQAERIAPLSPGLRRLCHATRTALIWSSSACARSAVATRSSSRLKSHSV